MAEWRKLANLIYARTCAADRADSRPGALLETLEDVARFMRLAAAWSLIFVSDGPSLATRLPGWMREGRLKQKEDVAVGLENAPKTLLRLFASQNFGKQLLKIADAPLARVVTASTADWHTGKSLSARTWHALEASGSVRACACGCGCLGILALAPSMTSSSIRSN
jgi:hypothetical protein